MLKSEIGLLINVGFPMVFIEEDGQGNGQKRKDYLKI